jgi:7,8-dihydropterin-6-yl-methyl-4-(beta-D-ribofuranosyl)aminobenzene 5'-phosphate synthase
MNRRMILKGAAALLLAPAAAARPQFAVPTVDRLELTVLIDGQVSLFGVPVTRPDIQVIPAPRLADHRASLLAQWGYSVLARTPGGTTLVDAGYTGDALLNNMSLLEVDPATIDAIVVSHGHWDHFGGLDGLLATGRIKRGTPLFTGGEEAFCERLRGTTAAAPDFGRLDRGMLGRAGVRLVNGGAPQPAAGGFTTGTIPLVSSERPMVPTAMLPGKGCTREALDPAKRDELVVDDAAHELGTAFHIKGRGLVVIGSCSHRGIINTVRQAQAVSGIAKVHAIVGGFHLVPPQTPAQALETVELMREINPDFVIPGHCSGEVFIAAIQAAMPDRVMRSTVGTRFLFGSRA